MEPCTPYQNHHHHSTVVTGSQQSRTCWSYRVKLMSNIKSFSEQRIRIVETNYILYEKNWTRIRSRTRSYDRWQYGSKQHVISQLRGIECRSYVRLYVNSVWILKVIVCLQHRILSISGICIILYVTTRLWTFQY